MIPKSRVKPVLSWPGGKSRLLKSLLPLIPAHKTYVEPFAGGLALLLAKPRSKVEIVNDLNGDLVSVYRCAQFHLEALCAEIDHTIFSRRNVAEYQQNRGLTELQRAARFLMLNKMSFGGGMTSYGLTKSNKVKSLTVVPRMLKDLRDRLDGVSVENLSYERILALYDAKETVFFLDPPYYNSAPGKAYTGWDEATMRDFASRVLALAGKWIVTVDDSPLNRKLFSGCKIQSIETPNGSLNRRLHPTAMFHEIIVQP